MVRICLLLLLMMHMMCVYRVASIFVDGTEILFGKEALPLALPTFVITVR